MKAHALDMYEAIQCGDFVTYGKLVGKTWEQNKALDSGTNPVAVEAIISKIQAYAWDINFREQAVVVTYIS